jgi:hypothetical protein
VAYVIPLAISTVVTSADKTSFIIAGTVAVVTNILIPTLSLPWVLVATTDHIKHHKNRKAASALKIFTRIES